MGNLWVKTLVLTGTVLLGSSLASIPSAHSQDLIERGLGNALNQLSENLDLPLRLATDPNGNLAAVFHATASRTAVYNLYNQDGSLAGTFTIDANGVGSCQTRPVGN
jgi:hypothetical protein